jgi:Superfamily II DNA/RNA helicases, SNF2 family
MILPPSTHSFSHKNLSRRNPVIDQQALYRCYRYGQEKPVFAYRFLTEGSMEEKVYSRSVNKINLAAIVIDQKDPKRNFTKKELSDILTMDNWVRSLFVVIIPILRHIIYLTYLHRFNAISVKSGECYLRL